MAMCLLLSSESNNMHNFNTVVIDRTIRAETYCIACKYKCVHQIFFILGDNMHAS